jgi:hypothetical protein
VGKLYYLIRKDNETFQGLEEYKEHFSAAIEGKPWRYFKRDIWTFEGNNQGMDRWHIFGPLDKDRELSLFELRGLCRAPEAFRTLDEITTAVRRNEPVIFEELRRAVVAYDVLLNQMHVETNAKQLELYFSAAESDPKEWAGPANDPDDPKVVLWHKTFIKPEVDNAPTE